MEKLIIVRRRPAGSTLFPYTTLFRSGKTDRRDQPPRHRRARRHEVLAAAAPQPAEIEAVAQRQPGRSEEHTSELQSRRDVVCRLLLEKKKISGVTGLHKIVVHVTV